MGNPSFAFWTGVCVLRVCSQGAFEEERVTGRRRFNVDRLREAGRRAGPEPGDPGADVRPVLPSKALTTPATARPQLVWAQPAVREVRKRPVVRELTGHEAALRREEAEDVDFTPSADDDLMRRRTAKEAAREAGLDRNQSALLKVASYANEDQVEAVSDIAKVKAAQDTTRRSKPRPQPLRNLDLTPGQLAYWVKSTKPINLPALIRTLRIAADILDGKGEPVASE
jgi:hypothetical protein